MVRLLGPPALQLHKVYAKLGVTSRTELRQLGLDDGRPADTSTLTAHAAATGSTRATLARTATDEERARL